MSVFDHLTPDLLAAKAKYYRLVGKLSHASSTLENAKSHSLIQSEQKETERYLQYYSIPGRSEIQELFQQIAKIYSTVQKKPYEKTVDLWNKLNTDLVEKEKLQDLKPWLESISALVAILDDKKPSSIKKMSTPKVFNPYFSKVHFLRQMTWPERKYVEGFIHIAHNKQDAARKLWRNIFHSSIYNNYPLVGKFSIGHAARENFKKLDSAKTLLAQENIAQEIKYLLEVFVWRCLNNLENIRNKNRLSWMKALATMEIHLPFVHIAIGKELLEMGKLEQAEYHFFVAFQNDPGFADPIYYASVIAEKRKDPVHLKLRRYCRNNRDSLSQKVSKNFK